MLVLSRRAGEVIRINRDIIITVLEIDPSGRVRLGIEAPQDVQIHREEVWRKLQQQEGANNAP